MAFANTGPIACRTRRALALGALSLSACLLEPDVVARSAESERDASEGDAAALTPPMRTEDAGRPTADGGRTDAGFASAQASCGSIDDPVVLVTAQGRLYGYDPQLRTEKDYGLPRCLQAGAVQSAAASGQGTIWISLGTNVYAITPRTDGCEALPLVPELSALAFVQTELQGTLYALRAGELLAIDPSSFEAVVLGELEATHLLTDTDGTLLAAVQTERGTVQIGTVDVTSAHFVAIWEGWLPADGLTGIAAVDPDGFWLFSRSNLYKFDRLTQVTQLMGPISDLAFDVAGVAAPNCAPGN